MEFNLSEKYYYKINVLNNQFYVSHVNFKWNSDEVKKDILGNYYEELINKLRSISLKLEMDYDSHHNHIPPFNRNESKKIENKINEKYILLCNFKKLPLDEDNSIYRDDIIIIEPITLDACVEENYFVSRERLEICNYMRFPIDYLTNYQMIWTDEGEYVLDLPFTEEEEIDEKIFEYKIDNISDILRQKIIEIINKNKYLQYSENEIKLDFYKIPLLKIKKIIPHKLYGCNYYSKKELKLETIKNLCDEYNNVNCPNLDKFHFLCKTKDFYNIDIKEQLNFGIKINCYNLFSDKNNLGIDLIEHDGCTILLELNNGETMEVSSD